MTSTSTMRRERAAAHAYRLLQRSGARVTWRQHFDTGREHGPGNLPGAILFAAEQARRAGVGARIVDRPAPPVSARQLREQLDAMPRPTIYSSWMRPWTR